MKIDRSGRMRFMLILAVMLVGGALIFAFFWFKPLVSPPVLSPGNRTVVRRKIPAPPPEPVATDNTRTEPAAASPPALAATGDQNSGRTETSLAPAEEKSTSTPLDQPASLPPASSPAETGQGEPEKQSESASRMLEKPDVPPSVDTAEPASGIDTSPPPEVTDASTPPSADAPTSKTSEQPTGANFTIQVGAFREKAYARQTVVRLQAKGYKAYILESSDARSRIWYFVRFGRFEHREAAAKALSEFQAKEKGSAMIANYKSP